MVQKPNSFPTVNASRSHYNSLQYIDGTNNVRSGNSRMIEGPVGLGRNPRQSWIGGRSGTGDGGIMEEWNYAFEQNLDD